jgi:hypothetical protein
MNISRTAEMKEYLEKNPREREEIDKMFKIRDLKDKLIEDLSSTKISKSKKVKL